jgi:hypothetical protein
MLGRNIYNKVLGHGCPNVFRQGATPLLWAGSGAVRGKVKEIGTPDSLNYCVIFIANT